MRFWANAGAVHKRTRADLGRTSKEPDKAADDKAFVFTVELADAKTASKEEMSALDFSIAEHMWSVLLSDTGDLPRGYAVHYDTA